MNKIDKPCKEQKEVMESLGFSQQHSGTKKEILWFFVDKKTGELGGKLWFKPYEKPTPFIVIKRLVNEAAEEGFRCGQMRLRNQLKVLMGFDDVDQENFE